MKIGNLEVEKILIGSQEAEKILLGADDIWEPESGAPTTHTYYYQISGGSKTQMTQVSEDQYDTGAISAFCGQRVRFFVDNDVIPVSAITDETSVGEFGQASILQDYEFEDGYLIIRHPIEAILFNLDSEGETPYKTNCTIAPVYLVVDNTPYEMSRVDDNDPTIYTWTPDSYGNIAEGTVFKIMTLGTYGTFVNGEGMEATSAFTAPYCYDNYNIFNLYLEEWADYPNTYMEQGGWDSPGIECGPLYAIVNDNNTFIEIPDDCTEYNTSDLGLTIQDNDNFYLGYDAYVYPSEQIEVYLNDTSIGYQPVTVSFAAPGMHSQIDRISLCGSQVNLYVDSDDLDLGGDDPGEFEF